MTEDENERTPPWLMWGARVLVAGIAVCAVLKATGIL